MPALQPTADDHLSRRIDAVDLKHRLGDVETDCRDRLHVWLPITATAPAAITQWHLRAGGGAVHSIRLGRLGYIRNSTACVHGKQTLSPHDARHACFSEKRRVRM